MARKTLEQSVTEAYAIASAAYALADAAVRGGIGYAEVAKALRSAMKVRQERAAIERRQASHERYLRQKFGDAVAEARLAAERSDDIDDLGLSLRAQNVCQQLGIQTVTALAACTPKELLKKKNVSFKTVRELQEKLKARSRSLSGDLAILGAAS